METDAHHGSTAVEKVTVATVMVAVKVGDCSSRHPLVVNEVLEPHLAYELGVDVYLPALEVIRTELRLNHVPKAVSRS